MDFPTTSLNDFFAETFSQDFLDDAAVEYSLAEIAAHAYAAKQLSGLSFRQLAERMGAKSPAIVQRIVNEAEPHNVTVATLVRFAHACGFELRVDFAAKERFASWEEAPQRAGTPARWLFEEPAAPRDEFREPDHALAA